jgi:hypothetical protein
MGLLDLKTDLKSLKFGNPPASDRPGSGNSGQPYITDPISSDIIPQNEDFLLRGGLNAPLDAANDVIRLTKFFGDLKSPRGVLFTSKQNILSRIGTATQASGNQSDPNSWKDSPLNEGAYTPLSTIAQAGVGFTGAHLFKQGLNPLKGVNTYTDSKTLVVGEDDGTNNRLVDLYKTKQAGISQFPEANILEYLGGPGSKLGVGKTNIKFATDYKGSPLRTGVNSGLPFKTYQKGTNLERQQSQRDFQFIIGNPFYSPLTSNGITKTFNTTSYPQFKGITDGLNNENNGGFGRTFEIGVYESGSLTPLPNELQYQKGKGGIGNSGTDRSTLPPSYSPLTNNGVTTTFKNAFPNSPDSSNLETGLINGSNGEFSRGFQTSVYESGSLKNTERANDNNSLTWDQSRIENQPNLNSTTKFNDPTLQDFRAPLIEGKKISTITSFAPDYANGKKTIDGKSTSRINQESPGQTGNVINYEKGKIIDGTRVSVVDHINFLPIYKSENNRNSTEEGINDLVKFRMGAVLRDGEKVYMHFRAFLNKFSDSYDAKWSGTQYMGRGEEFYKYGGFGRKISLSYTVAAQSKPELMAQYKKLNFLASTLAPDYGSNGYMGGVLTTLTLGGWCYELPGFINSLSLDIPQESPWEIAIGSDVEKGKGDQTVKEMPHICNVDMSFTPIHTFRPELQKNDYNESGNGEVNKYGNQQYIELTNGITNNYNNAISLKTAQKLK